MDLMLFESINVKQRLGFNFWTSLFPTQMKKIRLGRIKSIRGTRHTLNPMLLYWKKNNSSLAVRARLNQSRRPHVLFVVERHNVY